MKNKRIIATLLIIVMLSSLFPSSVLTVFAAEIEEIKAYSTIGSEPVGATNDLLVNTCNGGPTVYLDYYKRISDSLWLHLYNDGTLRIGGTGKIPDYDLNMVNRKKDEQINVDTRFMWLKYKNMLYAPEKGYYPSGYGLATLLGYRAVGVKSIVIEPGITEIGQGAFRYLCNLESVSIPKSVTKIGDYAFYGAAKLKSIKTNDYVKTYFVVTPTYPGPYRDENGRPYYLTLCTIENNLPETISYIGKHAFGMNEKLETVPVREDVKQFIIDDYAFEHCKGLVSAVFPATTQINKYAFYNSTLYKIKFNAPINVGDSAFERCSALSLIEYPAGLKMKNLGNRVFARTISLTNADMPICDSYGESMYESSGVYTANITNGINKLNKKTFKDCYNLNVINYPTSLETIDSFAFSGCSYLLRTEIPATVKSMGISVFSRCGLLNEIKLSPSIDEIPAYTFSECESLVNYTVENHIRKIGIGAFEKSGLQSIVIPDNVTRISSQAFYECDSLVNVNSPKGQTGVYIPKGINEISDGLFEDCDLINPVILNENIKTIGNAAFKNCASLKTVTLNSKVTSIGDEAFKDCRVLETIGLDNASNIPDSLETIGNEAFSECRSLKNLNFSNKSKITSIGNGAFQSCRKITTMDLFNTKLSYLGEYAFDNCSGMEYVALPETVFELLDGVFANCSKLAKMKLFSHLIPQLNLRTAESTTAVEHVILADTPKEKISLSSEFQSLSAHICYTLSYINGYGTLKKEYDKDGNEIDYSHKIYNEPYGPLPSFEWEDHDFVGWKNTDGKLVNEGTNPGPLVGDHVLYSYWLNSYYNVTFDAIHNGGTGVKLVIPYRREATLDLNDRLKFGATKDGWDFVGWNTDPNAKTGLKSLVVTDTDVYLYAIFKKDVENTFYTYKKGELVEEKVSVTYYNTEETTEIKSPACQDNGEWKFTGWATSADYDAEVVSAKGENVIINFNNSNYYAIFSKNYTLTYADIENVLDRIENPIVTTATKNISDMTKENCVKVTLPEKFNRPGFELNSWLDESNNKKYPVGAEITVDCDKTVRAIWDQYVYIISFNTRGGEEVNDIQVEFGEKYGKLPISEKEGYTFEGWYSDLSFENEITENSILEEKKNQILYAKWTPKEYKVSFYAYEGAENPQTLTVTYDSPYGVLPIINREYYVFDGWYTSLDEDADLILSDSIVDVARDHTLYAKWIRVSAELNLNIKYPDKTSEKITIVARYGEEVDLTEYQPYYEDYVFIGWYYDLKGENLADNYLYIEDETETINLYAGWLDLNEKVIIDPDDTTTAFMNKYKKLKSFELFGVQLRDKNDHSLRFMSRISEKILSKLGNISEDDVEYGFLVAAKKNINLAKGEQVTVSTEGVQIYYATATAFENDYMNFDDYRIFTMAIENMPENEYNSDVVARAFIKYKDINGDVHYIYTDDDASSNSIGGAYYTSYTKVINFIELNIL